MTTLDLPTQSHSRVPTRLDERRIHRLGHGARVDRRRLRLVCGTASAANQWLDKARREGLLIPVAWGEYQVVDEDVLEVLRHASRSVHRRLIAWALTLPRTLHPKVAFLAPLVWRHTRLAWDHPAPIVPVGGTPHRPPPQIDSIGYSIIHADTWHLRLGGLRPVPLTVPSRLDATILLGSNLDARWQSAAHRLAKGLRAPERLYARRQVARLRRFDPPRSKPSGSGLRTPAWWNQVHDRAVERLVSSAYEV